MPNAMSIEVLKGKTLELITVSEDKGQVLFRVSNGNVYRMWHYQDCCETVKVEEVIGDLSDLIGSPILEAEEASGRNDGSRKDCSESYTWTFYKLGTIKGHVTIRWLGESNGYYGENVDFELVHGRET